MCATGGDLVISGLLRSGRSSDLARFLTLASWRQKQKCMGDVDDGYRVAKQAAMEESLLAWQGA
jgi:hypothetical protein